ncbi:MAG: glycosyltransferase family 2 protein [Clostridia bacterium]|nr:glycosyltransferase family 2 protein [Clostridia bacterium]
MEILLLIIEIINSSWSIITALFFMRPVYLILGFFSTRKFAPAENKYRYAVLIAARNEEKVIGKLIESIRCQDYPSHLVDIFVVADNCTDKTADVARSLGAVCYERDDKQRRTKGFALQFLVENIRKDYGIEYFDGYFLFDADNLLSPDYITKMNDSFDAGEKIITSYRNTKNFDDNWISASYALHWIRTILTEHRARSTLHIATRIQGTGFLFAAEVIKDGWNYTSLTEDRAFCADAVSNGYKISYNNEAEFFDEQPVSIKIAMRQRIRWAKGHLQAMAETGPKLFSHIFVTHGMANDTEKARSESKAKQFFNNIRLRFMSFDMLTVVFPRSLCIVIKRVAVYVLRLAVILGFVYYFGSEIAPSAVKVSFDLLGINVTVSDTLAAVILLTVFTLASVVTSYLGGIIIGIYVFIAERKRIKKIKWYKKVWFALTFPMFDVIGRISMVIALFIKVEWKPIPHNVPKGIDELVEMK